MRLPDSSHLETPPAERFCPCTACGDAPVECRGERCDRCEIVSLVCDGRDYHARIYARENGVAETVVDEAIANRDAVHLANARHRAGPNAPAWRVEQELRWERERALGYWAVAS